LSVLRSLTAGIAGLIVTGSAMAGGGIEPITTIRVASGLTRPVGATYAPGDYKRLYIIQKTGEIRVLDLDTGSVGTFLDIDVLVGGSGSVNNEQGLLGIAFHPDYRTNQHFFVYYTNNSGNSVVSRYTATSPTMADAGSASLVWVYSQPFSNHNGGWIGFGPNDGYLYIGTGDGGSAGDPGNRGQDITNQLLGKILRIDVDGGSPYAIPPDNPFVGVTGDDEIWHYGLRNPWRCSFDRATGDLYIGDVGQNVWEELDYAKDGDTPGVNWGWRCREGAHNYNFSGACSTMTLIDPFHEYSHSTGFSITGGYVYRGCAIPSLRGTYFFADYGSARIWTVDAGGTAANLTDRTAELDPGALSINNIASFGEDADGEIYIIDQSGGEVFKVVPVTPTISEYDFNCDGVTGFDDLLLLLSKWGPCDGCKVDVDGDGVADFDDLLGTLADWG
jgi:glucose/arabinose dehydrogenase